MYYGYITSLRDSGTAVYMNTSQSSQSGKFSVSIDNSAPYTVDGFSNTTDAKCGISWSSPPLSNGTHTVSTASMSSLTGTALMCIRNLPPGCRYFVGSELTGGWQSRCLDFRARWVYVSASLAHKDATTDHVIL